MCSMFGDLRLKILRSFRTPILVFYRNFPGPLISTQYLVYGNESRLILAKTAILQNALFNVMSGKIIVEDYVFFGHNVSILTGTHDYHKTGSERQKAVPSSGRDIIIKKGVWIASNATILGPCVIGENSVIGPCCLIDKDVPPSTVCTSGTTVEFKKIKNLDS